MSEREAVDRVKVPLTLERLVENFRRCGMQSGMTLLAHSSLSQLGWVCGGAVTVLEALLQVLGPDGSLMMPTHTANNTDPGRWCNPPIPATWNAEVRNTMPAFDPDRTPSVGMGSVAELFRTWPGVVRSNHPVGSFAAVGPNAQDLVREHVLEDMFGESSPVGRLYELDGQVLLLGVGHSCNTSLHLAEHRAKWATKHTIQEGSAMNVGGSRKWVTWEMLALETDDFEELGQAYEALHPNVMGNVGAGIARLMPQRELVDFAVTWMEKHRGKESVE